MKHERRKSDAAAIGLLCLAALWPAAALPAEEAAIESHAAIRDAARDHALSQAEQFDGRVEVEVGRLDSRLKLARCDRALNAYDSPNGLNGGRGVVGVRCDGSKPWKIFVPVRLAVFAPVVVSTRPLVRGQAVNAADVTLAETDVSTLRQAYFTRIEDVVGLRSKRSVAIGKTLHAGLLERARLVRRGSQVQMVANTAGLRVTMQGKALADGSRGDRIRVKNLSSGQVVTGTVVRSGVIQVVN